MTCWYALESGCCSEGLWQSTLIVCWILPQSNSLVELAVIHLWTTCDNHNVILNWTMIHCAQFHMPCLVGRQLQGSSWKRAEFSYTFIFVCLIIILVVSDPPSKSDSICWDDEWCSTRRSRCGFSSISLEWSSQRCNGWRCSILKCNSWWWNWLPCNRCSSSRLGVVCISINNFNWARLNNIVSEKTSGYCIREMWFWKASTSALLKIMRCNVVDNVTWNCSDSKFR